MRVPRSYYEGRLNRKAEGTTLATKRTKTSKSKQGKASKKPKPSRKLARKEIIDKPVSAPSQASAASLHVPIRSPISDLKIPSRSVFSIEIGSIGGETTIGDLIVAFPRTRDVLMKHGLRFDVEEAGYLYMTLNVFSAIHGLATHNLVQELHTVSKEAPPTPSVQVSMRSVVTPPTQ